VTFADVLTDAYGTTAAVEQFSSSKRKKPIGCKLAIPKRQLAKSPTKSMFIALYPIFSYSINSLKICTET
jgi:hypothetical protein